MDMFNQAVINLHYSSEKKNHALHYDLFIYYFITYAFRISSRICNDGLTNLVSAARSGGVSRSDCRHVMKITTPSELNASI